MELLLDLFDKIRVVGGLGMCYLLLLDGAFPRKEKFWLRLSGTFLFCFFVSFLYLPVTEGLSLLPGSSMWLALFYALYYYLISVMVILIGVWCYEISAVNLCIRLVMAYCVENLITNLYCYGIIKILMPDFIRNHPVGYMVLTVEVYALIFLLLRKLMPRIFGRDSQIWSNDNRLIPMFVVLHLVFTVIRDASAGIFEGILEPIAADPGFSGAAFLMRIYCLIILVMVSLAYGIANYMMCRVSSVQHENDMLQQTMVEKSRQYALSQQNIALINQKCHDLKHQIAALAYAGAEERNRMIREAEKAVMIFDSVVRTENEALNTLLTEKSLYCTQRSIRLNCILHQIQAEQLDKINIIDLYTMLGNALDNAIECVSRFDSDEKKTVSLTIGEQGGMLLFVVENYNDVPLNLEDGLPKTSKKEKDAHGFGLKSIRMIAARYGGSLFIEDRDGVFKLTIAIPV